MTKFLKFLTLFIGIGKQLKDFILEPGTIVVEVDANNEEDYATGAKMMTGLSQKIKGYKKITTDVK